MLNQRSPAVMLPGLIARREIVERGWRSSLRDFFSSISKGQILPMDQKTMRQSIWRRKSKVKKPSATHSPAKITNPHRRGPNDVRSGRLDTTLYEAAPPPPAVHHPPTFTFQVSDEVTPFSSSSPSPLRADISRGRSNSWPSALQEAVSAKLSDSALKGSSSSSASHVTPFEDRLPKRSMSSPSSQLKTPSGMSSERKRVTLEDLLGEHSTPTSPVTKSRCFSFFGC